MHTGREAAAAVALENNKILVVGGEQCFPATFGSTSGFECTALNTAEIYDPATQTFTVAGSGNCTDTMTTARAGATATLINETEDSTYLDGRVLIVGGTTGQLVPVSATAPPPGSGAPTGQIAQNTAEIYDPATDTFTPLAATVPVPSTCGAGQYRAVRSGESCRSVDRRWIRGRGDVGLGPDTDRGRRPGFPASRIDESRLHIPSPHADLHRRGTDGHGARVVQPDSRSRPVPYLDGFATVLAAGGVNAASNVCCDSRRHARSRPTTPARLTIRRPTPGVAVSNSMSANRAAVWRNISGDRSSFGRVVAGGWHRFRSRYLPVHLRREHLTDDDHDRQR